MDWTSVSIVAATFLGPIAAVQAQKYLERHRDRQRARDTVFRALMANRSSRTTPEHVQALNAIELTFTGQKYKLVVEAWNRYHDLLNEKQGVDPAADQALFQRRDDAFWDLLHAMAKSLRYSLDRTAIKTGSYSPIAHDNLWRDQEVIRTGLVAVLTGKAGIPVIVHEPNTGVAPPPAPDGQNAAQTRQGTPARAGNN